LTQTVDALAAAHEEAAKRGILGYYPCTLTAEFQVQAGTNASLGVPEAHFGLTGSSTTGNVITVVLASPMCAPAVELKAVNQKSGSPNTTNLGPFLLQKP